jgi:pyochelin biosynthetic protein PchC
MTAVRETGAWIRRFHPASQAPAQLVCFPHAGGSATFYFPVSRSMSPAVDVLAIQYPGRQDRRTEKCIDDIGELADRVVTELWQWADRPLALFGHSMGASLAFEVASRLEAGGVAPLGLFASGRHAPSLRRDDAVHLRSDDAVLADLTALNGTESQLLGEPEMRKMILAAVRSDYKAAETYRCRPGLTLDCPIVSMVGDNDPKATIEEARAWSGHTTGRFDLVVFSGGHFYLNSHAPAVLHIIGERLAAVPTASSG